MNFKIIAALAAGVLCAAPAFSASVTLDFEGASSFQSIDGFYNGGVDGGGAAGANHGVLFGGDALALANDELGPYFSNAPSPGSIMTAVGLDAAMNVAIGFSGTASFFYSSTAATTVGIFSGLNGTGDLLGTFTLLANSGNGCDGPLCHWDQASVDFTGLARSIQFGSAANVAGFDNVAVAPVPLPAAIWLLGSSLLGLAGIRRRKS